MTTSTLTKTAAALALATAALSAQAGPVNLLTNGDFEDTLVTASQGWQIFNTIDGWVGNPFGVEVRRQTEGLAQSGKQFVELDTTANSTITQVINGLSTTQEYTLSFWYSPRINRTNAEDNQIDFLWNGEKLLQATGTTGASHDWQLFQYVLTGKVLQGPNTLSFAANGASNSFGGSLDNVSLTATPLPGAALLFGTSIAGFLAARKRRKAAALAA